jgi:hypothetical protein
MMGTQCLRDQRGLRLGCRECDGDRFIGRIAVAGHLVVIGGNRTAMDCAVVFDGDSAAGAYSAVDE